MKVNELKFHELSVKVNNFKEKTLGLLSGNQEAIKALKEALSKCENEEKLKIAFVGQHNSGKSTIISALTGNKSIKISNNVETDVPEDYAWGGVWLTDTPGLFAGKKEEHDKLSMQKITESDLLVFCITSSLFDNLIIKAFVDLAYKRQYKSKIFLLINKMSQEAGEFNELVKNYTHTLKKTLRGEGAELDDFPVAFIDAHDYITGIEENESELVKYSNFPLFINQLNNYIADKKLVSKLDTPCRLLIDSIEKEVSQTSAELDQNMMALLRQADSVIKKKKRETDFYIKDLQGELRNEIMAKSNAIISRIGSEEVTEADINSLNDEIENITKYKLEELESKVIEAQKEIQNEIEGVLSTDMAEYVFSSFETAEIKNINAGTMEDFSKFVTKYKNFENVATKGADIIVGMAGGAKNLGTGVSQVSQTALHTAVKEIGHFFGHSFKPWGAVNLAAKIGKFAKWLGPGLSVVTMGLDIVSKNKEDDQIAKVQQCKRDMFNQFSSISSDIASELNKQYKNCEIELFDEQIAEIENIRNGLIKNNNSDKKYVKDLKACRQEITDFITKEL
ncbi:MAG: 50S ribosome-binding GTPase [Treponemataceae bacterium]